MPEVPVAHDVPDAANMPEVFQKHNCVLLTSLCTCLSKTRKKCSFGHGGANVLMRLHIRLALLRKSVDLVCTKHTGNRKERKS